MTYRKDWAPTPNIGGQGNSGTRKFLGRRINLSTTDLGTSTNTIGAFTVPAGFTIDGCAVAYSDMDGGTSLSISLGDAALPTRYLNGDVTGRTGGTTVAVASTGLLYKNPAETEILITIGVAAGTPVAGTMDVYLSGFVT
jgi:hypothetical protein